MGRGQIKLPASHQERMRMIEGLIAAWEGPQGDEVSVALEDVQFSRFVKAHASYWKIRTLVELAAEQKGLSVEVVGVKTLKEWATGNGNADKPAMIQAAHRLFPTANLEPTGKPGTKAYESRKADICDAVLVAGWAAGCARPLPAEGSPA